MVVTDAPLAETFARLTALDPYLAARIDPAAPQGAWSGDDLSVPLERAFARVGEAWTTSDRRVQAAFVVNDYTWRLAAPAIGAFLLDGRVPTLERGTVVMEVGADGAFEAPVYRSTTYLGSRHGGAASNGDASRPAASSAMSDDTLVGVLRRALEDHLRPLVASVRRAAPLVERAQWALIGDACGSSFLHAGQAVGDVAGARRWAERFLALDGEPLRGRQRFFELRHAGRAETFMTRGSCCLVYRIDGHGYCSTCPFTPDDERERRLREWMASPD